ncbi:hypothetical protein GGR88_000175 [Sphingomonas jejuensis]|uniref:Alginate export domain-containing protein n=1 Tax=Sphingomonas jejuensis TaxID=904715 RepID=A0ABX0XIR5_9SPHN|nr:alginate export family protein [Sphingomonas jejuensis]NJC32701.1 hypothetical protein [Sphingomonas jejuensis]
MTTNIWAAASVAGLALSPVALPAQTVIAAAAPATAAPQEGFKERVDPTAAAPAAESYPAEAIGDGVTTGGYNQSRWVEDWTRFRDPSRIDDPIDRLKYVPLAADGDVYLTLSGELRLRSNHTTNPNLREARAQRQDITRIVAGADLHLGRHVRLFGELAHGGLGGVELGTPAATLRNDLVVQQSFVDVTGEIADVDLGVRHGRQTFADGPNLMVVPRDNNTIFFVFNGTRAWARTSRVRIDLFDFHTTRLGTEGIGDDKVDRDRRFSGVSTGIVLPGSWFGQSKLYLDPFVWRLRNDNAVWGLRTGREVRDFYGIHLWGDVGRASIDWTVNHQGGHFDGRPISAWQIFAAQTFRLGEARTAPRIGVHVDYATGGGSFDGGTLGTALAPFGNNVYYSYQLYATPTNFIAFAPNISFQPMPKVRATLEVQRSWRQDVDDAVYRANGTAFAGTQLGDARHIADTYRAQIVWTISPRVSVTGRYEHLAAGRALTDANYRSSDFLAAWLSLRF